MGGVCYLIGVGLAGYAGYVKLQWYFIFISSLVMAIGYFIVRAPQINGIVFQDGIIAMIKLLLIQLVVYSIITTPVYFIAAAFN